MNLSVIKTVLIGLVFITTLISCEDSETNNQPSSDATLIGKIWVASDGVSSLRIRFSSDGVYIEGDDNGFLDQGVWTWENQDEQIIKTVYQGNTVWYKFENLTTISVKGTRSSVKPYDWGEPIMFSLANN